MHQLALAWLATVVFAVSLGYFLYAYLFTFGVAAAGSASGRAALVDVALFSVFALHHSVFARTPFKRLVGRAVSPPLERAVYSLVASVLFLAVCVFWRHVPGVLYAVPAPWGWAGYAIQAAGLWLTFAGSRALDVLDLSGLRQVLATGRHGSTPATEQHGSTPATSATEQHGSTPATVQYGSTPATACPPEPWRRREQHGPTPGPRLITSGVYGIVRHPLYFGWALFVFGAPDMTLTRFTFAVISTAYLALAIPLEERSLIDTFGRDYTAYQRKVRWRMVPFLY